MKQRRLGVMGAGQLAQMMCLAGQQLGYEMGVYATSATEPATLVADKVWVGNLRDEERIAEFAQSVTAFAYDTEHLPIASVRMAANFAEACPHPELLYAAQNRIRERKFLLSIDIPMPRVAFIESFADLQETLGFGFPAVLKTAEQGYDGKGQIRIERAEDLARGWEHLGKVPCVLEEWVQFDQEMSAIIARDRSGEIKAYPLIDNEHRNHILHKSSIPSVLPAAVQQEAIAIARRIAEAGQLVGILAVEMFYTDHGQVFVNELAPRPHNSGHLTQLASTTSQFAQLALAMAGEALGPVDTKPAVMINLLGDLFLREGASRDFLRAGFLEPSNSESNVFFYGKKEARSARKMGHIIATGATLAEANLAAEALYDKYAGV